MSCSGEDRRNWRLSDLCPSHTGTGPNRLSLRLGVWLVASGGEEAGQKDRKN